MNRTTFPTSIVPIKKQVRVWCHPCQNHVALFLIGCHAKLLDHGQAGGHCLDMQMLLIYFASLADTVFRIRPCPYKGVQKCVWGECWITTTRLTNLLIYFFKLWVWPLFQHAVGFITNKVLKLLQASKQVTWAWATLQLCSVFVWGTRIFGHNLSSIHFIIDLMLDWRFLFAQFLLHIVDTGQ